VLRSRRAAHIRTSSCMALRAARITRIICRPAIISAVAPLDISRWWYQRKPAAPRAILPARCKRFLGDTCAGLRRLRTK